VAIKTLPKMSTTQAARLRKEARAMAMVTHPNLAVIHGIETWREIPFLVEEYLAGGTLAGRLSSSRPSLAEAMQLGITLADALEQLHVGRILHCDIKPSNIGFTQHGVVKLLDFGLARLLREVSPPSEVLTSERPGPEHRLVAASTHGAFAGTPHYMSPEAVQGEPPTPAVDIWGLSVVLYETIAGRRPFEGETAPEIFTNILAARPPDLAVVRPGCPPQVAALFVRLLSLDPAVRPRDSGALRHQLQALLPVSKLI
jgi:serine/threonine protein kinase